MHIRQLAHISLIWSSSIRKYELPMWILDTNSNW